MPDTTFESNRNGKAARRLFQALLVASVAFPLSTVAHAQAAPAAEATAPEAETITVTGSRIVRDGFQSPTPLSVIGTEQLASSASSNIAQAINTLPAFTGSFSPATATTTGACGCAGVNSLNLRSLGPTRTLILVDGHRVTPALPNAQVDINAIPQALVNRVDVVTGGVSSVYGSDAVAGVVNFVLNKTFTGIKGEVSGGETRYADGQNYKLNLVAGTKFAGGRGHIILAGEHAYNNGVPGGSRPWNYVGMQTFQNPAWAEVKDSTGKVIGDNGLPKFLVVTGAGPMDASPGGVVVSGPLRGTAFGQNGQIYQQAYGALQGAPYMQGGDWRTNDLRPENAPVPRESRQMAFGRVSYEFSDALNVYAQASWVKSKISQLGVKPYLIGTSGPLVQIDNAFLPTSVRDAMVAANITSIRVGTTNRDLGQTTSITDRETTSFSGGADGKFEMMGKTWHWDAFIQQGKSHNYVTFINNISRGNYFRAVDAVRNTAGQIVCRVNADASTTNDDPACAPYNPFGFGVNDPKGAGANYIHRDSWSDLTVNEFTAAASLSGDLFSTWAGPVSVALSGEYRKDSAHGVVDAISLAADHVFANFAPIDGSTNVKEVAIETAIPLAKESPFAYALDLNGAVRYTSYSLAGNVTTWKAGLTYSPIRDITFRVTRSRDIRAPNLQELFLPSNTARQSLFDPFTNSSPSFNQVTTGNPNLKPEKGDTLGIGVVVQPSFLPGFSASVDYWSINIKGAISAITATTVLNTCFDKSHLELCSLITRDAAGNLIQVLQPSVNIAAAKTRGLDFELGYRTGLDKLGIPGSLDLHANATHYLEATSDNGVGTVLDFVGETGGGNPPNWTYSSTLGYALNGFRAAATFRGFDAGKMFGNYIECTSGCPAASTTHPTVNFNRMPARLYIDLALSYDFSVGDGKSVTAFVNVRNLTNKDPGLSAQPGGNFFGNGANAARLYEVEGTVFRTGVRFKI